MYIVGDLMKSILVEITCPTCLWHTHKSSDTVVIPEFEPDLKQQLEQEEFYAFTCPRCGTRISFFHTCIYPDKQHHFVLLMKSEKEKKAADHHLYADMSATKRYISDARDIAEKIHILEEGFDDRVIEILKLKVYIYLKKQQRYPNTLRYKDRDKQSETIWFSYTENDQEFECASPISQTYSGHFSLCSLNSCTHRIKAFLNVTCPQVTFFIY